MILITGATGFLGNELIKRLYGKDAIRVVSRNEGKLIELKQQYPDIEIITGDISDPFIASKVCHEVDGCYHLAAFKHVGLAEKQPLQCTKSNIIGTMNLLESFYGKTFIAISTDKAAQVTGVYGATKLLMERVVSEYEELYPEINYRIVRYGNVLYSTGSVLCKWKDLMEKGEEVIVTDLEATRFYWTVDQAVDLIFDCIENAKDTTPYCPSMKSMKIGTLLKAMHQKYGKGELKYKVIGLQPGENKREKVLENGPYSDEVEMFTIDEIMQLI